MPDTTAMQLLLYRLMSGILASVIILTANPTHAAGPETLQRVQQTAETFIYLQHAKYDSIDIKFGYVDPRLQLAHCDQPLKGYFPDQAATFGLTVVGVECSGTQSWKVILPVTIRVFADVVVANRPIPRNTQLTLVDLSLVRRELSAIHSGAYTRLSDVADMVLRNPVNKDTVLTAVMLSPKRLVQRGETVTIMAESPSVVIRTQGIALMDGHRGQTIRIQNSRSGRQLEAEVVDPAVVRVKM